MEARMDIVDFTPFVLRWLANLEADLTRYAVFAVGVWLVLWVVLARPLAARKLRPTRPPAGQLLLEFAISIRSIALFSTIGLGLFILESQGHLPGPALATSWGAGGAVASFMLTVLAHDAYFYWTHRLMHDPRLFRAFHRRHHRSHNPSPFTAYSFDLAEAGVNAVFVPIWMLLVPTSWPIIGLFMVHQIARNTFAHCGYEIFPHRRDGRPLFDFLTTTTHHDLHHGNVRWNYGFYFTFWDRLMGTEHPDYHARFAAAVGQPLLEQTAAPQASRL
jgi:sterol desaturase/sphingolipid hydroxylase (fatty acid hydroxylase superfamily)